MLVGPVDQQYLLTLAELDSGIGRSQHITKALPQHARVAELIATRQAITSDLVATTTRAQDLELSAHQTEPDLTPVRARLERENRRVDDGPVTDPEVPRGLVEEAERIERRITELGDAGLGLMRQLEEAAAERDELVARKKNVEDKLRTDVAARDAEADRLSGGAKAIAPSRVSEAKRVPAPLLTLYERIRMHSGLGAAKLHRGRCSECQLELTVSDLDTYRKAPQNEVLRRAERDQILIRTANPSL